VPPPTTAMQGQNTIHVLGNVETLRRPPVAGSTSSSCE
jgi:hypothetical protein